MPIPQLPYDIISEILSHLFGSHRLPSPPSRPVTPRASLPRLLLVSKAFLDIGLPLLYQSISICPNDWALFFGEGGIFVGDEMGRIRRSWVRELRLQVGGGGAQVDFDAIESFFENGIDPEDVTEWLEELQDVSFPNIRSVGIIPGLGRKEQKERLELIVALGEAAEEQDLVFSLDGDGDPCYCNECISENYSDVFERITATRAAFVHQFLKTSLPHLSSISLSITNCASPHFFERYLLPAFLDPACHATLRVLWASKHLNEGEQLSSKDERQSAAAHLQGLQAVLSYEARVHLIGFNAKARKATRKLVEQRSEGETEDLANWTFVGSEKSTDEAFLEA